MEPAAFSNPKAWAQHGPLGLVCLALFVLMLWLMDAHRDERKEMRVEAAERAGQLMGLQRETNAVLRDLTQALQQNNDQWRMARKAP